MIFGNAKPEWDEKGRKAVEHLIEGFLRAGGRPTVDEWKRMDSVEREIMVDVAHRIRLEGVVVESGDLAVARDWVATLPKEDRERIVAELLSKNAAEREGKKK